MNLLIKNNVLSNPTQYVDDIYSNPFIDVNDEDKAFKGIQPRSNDEFSNFCLNQFPNTGLTYNFIRQSPFKQEEPNFIHTDEMMGDITCILYLNELPAKNDGTIFYNDNDEISVEVKAEFNKMIAFNAEVKHSRAIFDNYGEGKHSRLVQVIFLKKL
jgi:hypothetical protein